MPWSNSGGLASTPYNSPGEPKILDSFKCLYILIINIIKKLSSDVAHGMQLCSLRGLQKEPGCGTTFTSFLTHSLFHSQSLPPPLTLSLLPSHTLPLLDLSLTLLSLHTSPPITHVNYSVPLRTGTCYIRDIFVLFLQDYCALQELLIKMNFTIAVAPPFVHPMTSLPATPTHSVRKYGFFSEPTRQRKVAKYGNLKRCESLSFSGDIESLEPSKF